MEEAPGRDVRRSCVRRPVLGVLFRESRISGRRSRERGDVFGTPVPFDLPRRAFSIGVSVRLEDRIAQGVGFGVRLREPSLRRHPASRVGSPGRCVHPALAGRKGVRDFLKSQFAGVFRRALPAARIFPFSKGGAEIRVDSRAFFDMRPQRQLERDCAIPRIFVVPVFRFFKNRRHGIGGHRVVFRVFPAFPRQENVRMNALRDRRRCCRTFAFEPPHVLSLRRGFRRGRMVFFPPQRRSDEFRRSADAHRPCAFPLFRPLPRFLSPVRSGAFRFRVLFRTKNREART